MSTAELKRWGAAAIMGAGLLLLACAAAVVMVPGGGLANPIPATLYLLLLLFMAPALVALYAFRTVAVGRLGFAGFVLGLVGSLLYSGPALILVAGTSGVESWHDAWAFAMGGALPLGASAFLIGCALLGFSLMRDWALPRTAGLLFAIGSLLWLVAFFTAVPGMLPLSNVISGLGLLWLGRVGWIVGKSDSPVDG